MSRLYGIAEIAKALGVSRGLVAQWYRRGKLPEPTARLAMGPVWTGRRITRWLDRTGGEEVKAGLYRRTAERMGSACDIRPARSLGEGK